MGGLGLDGFGAFECCGTAEDHEIDERIGAEPVGAVNRHRSRFADREETGNRLLRVFGVARDHLAPIVRRDAAHIVVDRRQHRDRLAGDIAAGEDAGRFGNARQPLLDHLGIEMLEMKMDMVLEWPDAAAFADLDRHRT